LTQENGKLHLQLKDAEFEVEMLKEDTEKMVAVMKQSHEVQREATQALVQAEARAVKAQGKFWWLLSLFVLSRSTSCPRSVLGRTETVERLVKKRDRTLVIAVDDVVIDVPPEPQVLANTIDFFVENGDGDQAEAKVEVSFASSPLSVRPRSPPEALVQQLQALQQRVANEEAKCEGLQREVP
jgi:hypothetical protein